MSEHGPKPFEIDPKTIAADKLEPEPEPALPAKAEVTAIPRQRKGWFRLGGVLVAGIIGVLAIQLFAGVRDRIVADPWTGWPLAAFAFIVVTTLLVATLREWLELKRLGQRANLREQAERIAGSDLHGQAPALLSQVSQGLRASSRLPAELQAFETADTDHLSDGERLRLYETRVLAPLDRQANRIVLEGSRDIGLLTALSPYGLLDGIFVLWRTLVMMRAIARLYGMAPRMASSLLLLRRSLRNAALAGLADVVTHATLEHVGASLAALLSSRAGQGAGNALLSARLGIEAMRQSRPLPYIASEPPRLGDIRKALFDQKTDSDDPSLTPR